MPRSRTLLITSVATVAFAAGLWTWNRRGHERPRPPQSVPSGKPSHLQGVALSLGLVTQPVDALERLDEALPRDFELRTKHGILAILKGVRSRSGGLRRGLSVERARFTLKGPLGDAFDEWRSIVRSLNTPVEVGRADLDFEDRLWSRVHLLDVTLKSIESGYVLGAKELELGQKRWKNVTFRLEKQKTILLLHWGGTEPGSRPFELRYVPTPGAATEWILEIPSQPLSALEIPGIATLPCSRVTGVLSVVVPEDPQLKMRGRFQSVADNCQGPNWPESNALFGGSIGVAISVTPEDDHTSWNLGSVEFTSTMFELRGRGQFTLQEEPELTWNVTGSRTCAQLQANLAPSRYLQQVKTYLASARGAGPARRAEVTLNMRGRVRASATLERDLGWHLSGNCGIADASDPNP